MIKKFDKILIDELLERNIINQSELKQIVSQLESSKQNLSKILANLNIISENEILKIFSQKLNLKIVNLNEIALDKSIFEKVPLKIAFYYKFVPIQLNDKTLTIATSWPIDIKTQDEIRMQIGFDLAIVLATENDISNVLNKFYGVGAEMLEGMTEKFSVNSETTVQIEKIEDIEKLATDASVIRLVNQIILDAYRKRATDIHIQPYREGVTFRYRIDGILYDANVPAEVKNFLGAIVSRIKIMSNLNIVEKRLPQDGRAIVKVQDQILDLRISTLPTFFGESVVIRILPTKMLFSLEKLGLSKSDLQTFEKIIQKPYGIIFVTGPTGSGKTTTLYACLNRLNTKDKKIITIEDPIEYEIPSITQVQVFPEIGLDFATGLKHILRHDPDIIMVGEVRDLETAEIAIRVALTGHLVFSTLHTNDAASGITRLLDIGVEPYLVSSSVEAFIAQRLVRLLCDNCKYEDKAPQPQLRQLIAKDLKLDNIDKVKIYRAKGCPICNFTGYFGRTAIYEILAIDEQIKELILKKAPANQIKKIAMAAGMKTLRQDGWLKVIETLTTPEEIIKVTPASSYESEEVRTTTFFFERKSADKDKIFEHRIYPRISTKINISYRIIKSEEDLSKKDKSIKEFTVTKNISAGGLLFISKEKIDVGNIIEVTIELPDGINTPIECLAKVVRLEEIEENKLYYIGICFLDMTSEQRFRLEKFINLEIS
ncbi:MAG: Flp pilus assembly complex ATPase component TadA [Candidatus Omnitrophica bacterium]|nr:Flp pilus assembly complex ATPase component TadA [Candidatus Omnitrophota bacterium]